MSKRELTPEREERREAFQSENAPESNSPPSEDAPEQVVGPEVEGEPLETEDETTEKISKPKICILGEKGNGKTSLFYSISRAKSLDDVVRKSRGRWYEEFILKPDPHTLPSATCVTSTWEKRGFRNVRKLLRRDKVFFIVVFDLIKSVKENKIRYWLKNIRRTFPDAEILPVLTHLDNIDSNSGLENEKERAKMESLFNRYGGKVLSPIKVSNTTEENISEVREVLKQKFLKR